jgi:F0F1-type ATP synthase membrane subunit c/vacuolar-type H+-ATPase subunit K
MRSPGSRKPQERCRGPCSSASPLIDTMAIYRLVIALLMLFANPFIR